MVKILKNPPPPKPNSLSSHFQNYKNRWNWSVLATNLRVLVNNLRSHFQNQNHHRWNWSVGVVILVTIITVAVQSWIGYQFYHNGNCDTASDPMSDKASYVRQALQQQPLSSTNTNDKCQDEYARITAHRTPGLTQEDLKRSFVYSGNRQRLALLYKKLEARQQPVTAVVAGGSISLGHGVEPGLRYSDRLATWMNEMYPLSKSPHHQVLNKGSHGADVSISVQLFFLVAMGISFLLLNDHPLIFLAPIFLLAPYK